MGYPAPYWDFSRYADEPMSMRRARGHGSMRLDDFTLKTIVFLGGLREDGGFVPYGTAFFVMYPIAEIGPDAGFSYLVTAKHVLEAIKASKMPPVARINQKDADATIGALAMESWITHPTDPNVDIAITPIQVDGTTFDYIAVHLGKTVLTPKYVEDNHIGVGDEVAVVGLLTRHFGKSRNIPIVRIGNIAAMPVEPVDLGAMGRQEVYLIESRSIGGLSGSPVFLNTPPYRYVDARITSSSGQWSEYLIGVNIGLFETLAHADRMAGEPLDKREAFLETMSAGIAVVVPVERIMEILESKPMSDRRDALLKKHYAENGFVTTSAGPRGPSLSEPKMEVLVEPVPDNPSHKEDFTLLLGAAVKANKPVS